MQIERFDLWTLLSHCESYCNEINQPWTPNENSEKWSADGLKMEFAS